MLDLVFVIQLKNVYGLIFIKAGSQLPVSCSVVYLCNHRGRF